MLTFLAMPEYFSINIVCFYVSRSANQHSYCDLKHLNVLLLCSLVAILRLGMVIQCSISSDCIHGCRQWLLLCM